MNNTAGDDCGKCRPGYYGDAVAKKDCKDCKCNLCGSGIDVCNRTDGQCQCKNNVVGKQCSRCKVSEPEITTNNIYGEE